MEAGLTATDRATLVDPDQQATFADLGYVTVPLLDEATVEKLRAVYEEVFPEATEGFLPTTALPDPGRKARADARVREILDPLVSSLFDRHRSFYSSFLMKWPDEGSALPLHQDTSYVDERRFRSAVVWIALDDTSEDLDNGPLQVISRSHRFVYAPRGTRTRWPYDGLDDFIHEHCLTALPARRGDALVMDNALVHCSFPNRSGEPRLAVAIAMAPVEADLLHAVGDGRDSVTLFDIDEQFFLDTSPYDLQASGGIPERYVARETIDAGTARVTVEELSAWCGVEAGPSPVDHGPSRVEAGPSRVEAGPSRVDHEPLPGPTSPPPSRMTRVLDRSVGGLMRVNNRLLRSQAEPVPVLDPVPFGWPATLEEGWADIRAEVDALLAAGVHFPRIEEVVGRHQGNEGDWNTFVLVAHGERVEFNCDRCPRTAARLDGVPGLQSALFSVFTPHTHLPAHRAPNRGVLRYHLGVVVPEPDGACRLRVGDQTVVYRERESVLFDDTFEHEAWNDADAPRITLLLEVVRPLDGPARAVNWLTQKAFGLYPEARGSHARLEELEWALHGGAGGGEG